MTEEQINKKSLKETAKEIYEKKYKLLMAFTFIFLIFSVGVLGYNKLTTGEFMAKDVTLKGGTLVTIQTNQNLDTELLKQQIEDNYKTSSTVRSLRTAGGDISGYSFELAINDRQQALEIASATTGVELTDDNYTIEQVSSALGESFFRGMITALVIAFAFMSLVVFLFFRDIIPSAAVILAAVSDLAGTAAVMSLIGMPLTTSSIAAFLMLVGYSVDTDILLSTRVLKNKEGTLMERIYSAIKTGLTMQLTSAIALIVLFVVTPAPMLKQIALILAIGLIIDIFNTWIQNTGILRWYMEGKHGKD